MSKAKSRLSTLTNKITENVKQEQRDFKINQQDKYPNKFKFSNLIIAFCFYFITYYLITSFYPEQIKNTLIANSYIIILISLFFGNLFFFGFLSLRLRRGFLISFLITSYFFLKLQDIYISWQLFFKLGLFLLFFELIFMYLQKLRLKK